MIYILTMVFIFNSKPTSIAVEYESLDRCMKAAELNRNNLKDGSVVLSTCTKK